MAPARDTWTPTQGSLARWEGMEENLKDNIAYPSESNVMYST